MRVRWPVFAAQDSLAAKARIAGRALSCALLLMGLLAGSPVRARAAAGCGFVLGFQALHDAIPEVGACLDDEHPDPSGTGNELQDATGGLLVWNRSNNLASFTNGYWTWIAGPYGLQKRLNSSRFSWEAPPSQHVHKTVVFVAGYDSSSADAASTFQALEQTLMAGGGYEPQDFVVFSYSGADRMADGSLRPRPYAACDADGPLDHSGPALATFLSEVQAWKGGRLVVVGHSLGGLLAYQLPRWSSTLPLSAVVSVDAPLHGIGAALAFASLFNGCGAAAAQDMAALAGSPDLAQRLLSYQTGLHAMGAQVGIVDNSADCVYNLALCGLPGGNDSATQVGPSDWALSVNLPGNIPSLLTSHMASLSDPATLAGIAQFLGHQD